MTASGSIADAVGIRGMLSAVEFAIGGSCERILLFARNTFAFGHGRHTTVVKRDVRFVDTPLVLVLEAALANTRAEVEQLQMVRECLRLKQLCHRDCTGDGVR